jgi:hypothetical protein
MSKENNVKTKIPCLNGSHGKYSKGCRCEPCTVAHRIYCRNRKRLKTQEEYGFIVLEDNYVDAKEARDHLKFLSKNNIGLDYVSKKTGVSKSSLERIKAGQKKVLRKNEEKILAIPSLARLDGQYVSSAESKKMIQKMVKAGYRKTEIGRYYNGQPVSIRINRYIRKYKHDRIKEIYNILMSPKMLQERKNDSSKNVS